MRTNSIGSVPTVIARAGAGAAPRQPAPQPPAGLGVWQALELWQDRIEARLTAFAARQPAPGKDGRGIARAAIEQSGNFVLYFTDGSYADLGRIVGKDGAPADQEKLAELAAAVAAITHQFEDYRNAVAQANKTRADADAEIAELRARIEAMRPFVAKDWTIDQDGDLVAILADNRAQRIGRVVGRDGKDGAPGRDAVGTPGRDGRDGKDGKDGAAAAWSPQEIAAAFTDMLDKREKAKTEAAPKPPQASNPRAPARIPRNRPAND